MLSGSGVAYVDVTLARTTVLDYDNFFRGHDAMTGSYAGDFAGFAVLTTDARRHVVGGAVLVRGRDSFVDGGYPKPVSLTPAEQLTLPRGRYRFVYLGDGPGRVSVRILRGATASIHATARNRLSGVTAARYALGDLVPGPNVAVGTSYVPFTLADRGVVVGSFYSAPGSKAPAHVSLCIRPAVTPPQPCDSGAVTAPGESITITVTDRRNGSTATTGPFRYEYTEVTAGPTARDGNAFVVSFAFGA